MDHDHYWCYSRDYPNHSESYDSYKDEEGEIHLLFEPDSAQILQDTTLTLLVLMIKLE